MRNIYDKAKFIDALKELQKEIKKAKKVITMIDIKFNLMDAFIQLIVLKK